MAGGASQSQAPSVASPAKKLTKFEMTIREIRTIYPDLKDEEVFDLIQKIKKENNETLRGLTMNDIMERVSEKISPGMYFANLHHYFNLHVRLSIRLTLYI